jgi:hypothetical protein
MRALRASLRQRLWCRVLNVRAWVRWHLPVSRDTALRLAEEQAEAYCLPLEAQIRGLFAAMEVALDVAGLPRPEPRSPDRRPHLEVVR